MDFSFAFLLKWKIKSRLSLLLLFSPLFKTIPSSNKALKCRITQSLGPSPVGQGRRRNKVEGKKKKSFHWFLLPCNLFIQHNYILIIQQHGNDILIIIIFCFLQPLFVAGTCFQLKIKKKRGTERIEKHCTVQNIYPSFGCLGWKIKNVSMNHMQYIRIHNGMV